MKWISCMCSYIPSFLDIHSTPLHPTHVIIREHQSELPVLYSKFPLAIYFMKWSEVARSCPTLCNPMDCSLSGSSVHGIFQARVLEWGAIAFSTILYMVVYICQSQSPNLFHPPLLPAPMSIYPFSTAASLFLPWKWFHLYHFSRFHRFSLIHICFSLSDLLYFVWETLGSTASLQMT